MGLIGDIIDWCFGNNGNGHAPANDQEIEMQEDTSSIRYNKEKKKVQTDIDKASAESPEIGGADVMVTFARAEDEAKQLHWDAATELLENAHRKALLVIKRKPYLTARLENEPKIKAATKIKKKNPQTNTEYGKEVEAKWKVILEQGKKDEIANATAGIRELVALINGTITPALKQERDANALQLNDLKNQMAAAKGNPQLLRQISDHIFQNTAQAEELGIDPGENARKEFSEEEGSPWTAKNCEETFVAYDWFALKTCRKQRTIKLSGQDRPFSDDDMWKLVQYRGKVVNEEIDKLRQKYPTLIASASGSEDIESDIDIAFATPGSGNDVKAAKEFNAAIKSRFKKPPGRVFDVNIYPRDYRALRGDSFKPSYNVDEIKDVGIDEPETEESGKLSMIDQDVATLLKQRRFLEEDQFNEMLKELLSKAPDEKTKKRIEKQYEEGEDIYLLTSLEKVEKIRGQIDFSKKSTDKHAVELQKKLGELDQLKNKGGKADLAKAQRLIPQILDLFEETFPDETMDVTDALYLEKMESLREDQEEIRTLKQPGDPQEHHKGQQCDEVHAGKEHEEWLMERLDGLEVKVKKDMFTNIIFANEAIMSQGALNHVVGALQAKTPEAKKEAADKLTASDLMQSVNEQVADLFKEMKHFDGVVEEAEEGAQGPEGKKAAKNQATGEGYVHASKYFFRLLNAANFMNLKYPKEKYPTIHEPYAAVNNQPLEQLEKRINDVLLKLRKSAVIPPDVKGEVGAFEFQEIFPGVTDIKSFRKMIASFAIELNRRIRSLDEFKKSQEMASEQEKQAEKGYFKAATTPRPKAGAKATAGAK